MKALKLICIAIMMTGTLAVFGQSIVVTRPTASERWALGDDVVITWTASGLTGNVRINLNTSSGELAGHIVASVPAAPGSRSWRVGELTSGTVTAGERYRIRIRHIDSEIFGESAVFQIGLRADHPAPPGGLEPAPQLAVTAPRRTDRWCRGQPYAVAWTAGGVLTPNVRITLRQDEREVMILNSAAPNSGSYRWPIPVTLATGFYAVRVAPSDLSRYDDSDVFEVVSCVQTPLIDPDVEVTPVGRLRVTAPRGGENWSAYNEYHIEWESPATSICGTRVDVKAVACKGGAERLIAAGVLNREGRNYYLWNIGASSFDPGQYNIRLVGSSGCVGTSSTFHVSACDYGIEGVTLMSGRPLGDGVTWEPGSSLEVSLMARVSWNRVLLPVGTIRNVNAIVRLRDGSERLVETAPIGRGGFQDGVYSVPMLLNIPMADVAVPMNMRIPIRFQIRCDLDRVGFNDEWSGELRLLGHEPTDLTVRLDGASLHLTRLYDALPTPTHRFSISVYAQNLTPNAAGGAPPPVPRVKCRWRMEERETGGDWHGCGSDSFYFTSVPYRSELRMTAQYGVNLDEGKDYALVFEIDPDGELNDPQRGNNRASVRFHLPD